MVRDWGSNHKELLVGEHVDGKPWVNLEGLPGYATELNPVQGCSATANGADSRTSSRSLYTVSVEAFGEKSRRSGIEVSSCAHSGLAWGSRFLIGFPCLWVYGSGHKPDSSTVDVWVWSRDQGTPNPGQHLNVENFLDARLKFEQGDLAA